MIHTTLSDGEYEVVSDSGLEIDAETTMVTRTREVVFRGALSDLVQTFRFGEQSEIPDASQSRLYCAGPRNVRMIDGTNDDPHWSATIQHVGLHSYVHGSRYSVFRLTPLWTAREVDLPKEYPDGTGAVNTFYAGTTGGYLPTGTPNGDYTQCTIHDHMPEYNVRGIMYTGVAPHPSHPFIAALIASIGNPDFNNLVNYGTNAFAGYNWCKGMATSTSSANNTVGKWFVGDIRSPRLIEPLDGTTAQKIYDVEFSLRWLQRKQPI